ncbi:MAG TPA: UDP-2,3-diacylglucosamine diphosphatase LpxI [Vicinamibacteria bacterium]
MRRTRRTRTCAPSSISSVPRSEGSSSSAGRTTTTDRLPEHLGLIAGEGRFPFLVLEEARRLGLRVTTLLIEGEADPSLAPTPGPDFHWVRLGELSRAVRILREAGAREAILAGRVKHAKVFDILRPDPLTLKVLTRLRSRSTEAMLLTVADVLAEEGIALLDSTVLLRQQLATGGPMTRRKPGKEELESLRFGLSMAKGLSALDIGQTVVVKRMAVVAAEAMEGTDRAIRRAAEVSAGPFVVVKVARPRQDMRFDVPVVGPGTIDSMEAAGASVLGLESGRVLLLEREELLRRANDRGLGIYGLARE